jgi:hypothetical protein
MSPKKNEKDHYRVSNERLAALLIEGGDDQTSPTLPAARDLITHSYPLMPETARISDTSSQLSVLPIQTLQSPTQPSQSPTRSHSAEVNNHLYDVLDQSKLEVRTITIAPGTFEQHIICELHIVSLLDDPPYEALSYAWGDKKPWRKVFINGTRCQVGENLESALRHLRYMDKPRTMWVDALSINQSDIQERNSQVKHMGTIYKKASVVLAWLGPEYNDSDLAFDFLEMMPNDPEMHWDPDKYPELRSVYTLSHTHAVNELYARDWWQRVWTVQESVLCPVLRFVCGHRELLADQAFAVGACYFKHMYVTFKNNKHPIPDSSMEYVQGPGKRETFISWNRFASTLDMNP